MPLSNTLLDFLFWMNGNIIFLYFKWLRIIRKLHLCHALTNQHLLPNFTATTLFWKYTKSVFVGLQKKSYLDRPSLSYMLIKSPICKIYSLRNKIKPFQTPRRLCLLFSYTISPSFRQIRWQPLQRTFCNLQLNYRTRKHV